MKITTKLLGLGLAGSGLLLSACEVPGGGDPLRTIVIPNPGEAPTRFSGFPATFQGTNVIRESDTSGVGTETILRFFDAFETTVQEPTALTISCDVADDDTWIYIDSDGGDLEEYCEAGPTFEVTVDGDVYIEIGQDSRPGIYPYSIRADLDIIEY